MRYKLIPALGKFCFLLCLTMGFISPVLGEKINTSNGQAYHFRLLIQKNNLRFVLSSPKPIKYVSQRVANPSRFILNIPQARLINLGKKTTLSNSLVKSFQMDQRGNGLHVVFDLIQTVNPTIHIATSYARNEHQLIVDFVKSKALVNKKLDIPQPKEFVVMKSSVHLVRHTKKIEPKKVPPLVHKKIKNKFVVDTPITDVPYRVRRNIIIVIDPGHGGKDPGAIGRSGYQEKTIVLAIAKRLARAINRQPGFRAKLTRQGDYYIGLRERLMIARRAKADLFISIHADAFHNPASRGISIFALSQRGATSEAARWLAHRENISETLGNEKLSNKDHLLSSVLINLSQNHTIGESLKIGESMLMHFNSFSKLHHRHVEQAAFVVLKSPDIPSLLVETGFLSNKYEERRLATPWYQERVAHALMIGIKQYFLMNPLMGSI